MHTWLLIDIISFLFVAIFTGVLIPQILLIAFRKNLFDQPDERKIHTLPVPRLGGIAFLPATFFTLLVVCGIGMVSHGDWLRAVINFEGLTQCLFLGGGMMLLYIVGIADDLIGVRYRAKFFVQIATAMLLVAGGLVIDNLHGLFGIGQIDYLVAAPFTILVIVFITNAINLIDGIDGLASGLSFVASLIFGFICLFNGAYLFSLIAFCILGALLSFFCFNVFGNAKKHKKIFMGDTGSLTIGLILSALSLRLCGLSEFQQAYNPAVVAFSPLLIPGLDVVRVYLHRVRNHTDPFLPDKNHIHHKLLAIGMTSRQAMISIVAFSALLSVINIHLSTRVDITWLFVCDVIVWTLLNLYLTWERNKGEIRVSDKL